MPKLFWDKVGEKLYETGVRQGVLYVQNAGVYPLGVAWNGLTGVTESPSGAEATPLYADDSKYLNLMSAEEFGATVEAYTYPDEFGVCDGSVDVAEGVRIGQQGRKTFGLAYRTGLGNDTDGLDHGYNLHLVYGALAAPSEKGFQTVNNDPDAITFSWEVTTTPAAVTNRKPTAQMTINSTKVDPAKLQTLENILYGTDVADPRLPLPDEVIALFAGAAPEALTMSSIVPDEAAANVAVDSNIVITFNNKIAKESILVTSAAGVVVPGTKTLDATGKILTFDPTGNLTAGTTYLVTLIGVTDIYSQALPVTVKNFATVA